MQQSELCWNMPLVRRPHLALITLGTFGPNLTQKFRSEHHWWLHLYCYTATLRLDGIALPVYPGCVSMIAPGTDIEYDFDERATHLCAHFSLPPAGDAAPLHAVPALQNAGGRFPALYQSLEDAAACFAGNPLRAEVRLWDILWQLAERGPSQTDQSPHLNPTPVQQVRQTIELRLAEPLSVKQLASEAGISHNHLTRLFHQAVGSTLIGYIRARRVLRAQHLLEHTTLPVKTIAEQVGIDDPRQFYKLVQAHLGQSPTQVRQTKKPETEPRPEGHG